MTLLLFALLQTQATMQPVMLENAHVRVTRNVAPCAASHAPDCGERVFVALAEVQLPSKGGMRRLRRGDVAVFSRGE